MLSIAQSILIILAGIIIGFYPVVAEHCAVQEEMLEPSCEQS